MSITCFPLLCLIRYLQNYKNYGKIKEKICTHLGKMRTVLGQSIFPLPASYKAALERLEQSKVLVIPRPQASGSHTQQDRQVEVAEHTAQFLPKKLAL